MKVSVLFVATVVILLMATSAQAAVPIEYLQIPPDNTNPVVTACTAWGVYGQSCRMCWPTFKADGSGVEKWTCVAVKNSENFCTCGDMSRGGCYQKGLCKYVN